MVSQKRKLLAAGGVLALGFGLALPFSRRRDLTPPTADPPLAKAAAAASPQTLAGPVVLDGQFSPQASVSATAVSAAGSADAAAIDASLSASTAVVPAESAPPATGGAADEIVTARPVYVESDGVLPGGDAAAADGRRIHVIHNGDTLERLAERYLGDRLRALELFDLNRDLLENPHLLPIGAELRIPASADGSSDSND